MNFLIKQGLIKRFNKERIVQHRLLTDTKAIEQILGEEIESKTMEFSCGTNFGSRKSIDLVFKQKDGTVAFGEVSTTLISASYIDTHLNQVIEILNTTPKEKYFKVIFFTTAIIDDHVNTIRQCIQDRNVEVIFVEFPLNLMADIITMERCPIEEIVETIYKKQYSFPAKIRLSSKTIDKSNKLDIDINDKITNPQLINYINKIRMENPYFIPIYKYQSNKNRIKFGAGFGSGMYFISTKGDEIQIELYTDTRKEIFNTIIEKISKIRELKGKVFEIKNKSIVLKFSVKETENTILLSELYNNILNILNM